MEIILKKDMPNIGLKNEIVEVKPGYGRNYLIPQGIAILATESAKKQHAELMKQRAHKEEKIKNEALELAAKLENIALTIGTKASSTGKIFGSVNTIQVAESLAKAGFEIDRKKIILKDNVIKELGAYSCEVLLYKGVKVKIALEVIAE